MAKSKLGDVVKMTAKKVKGYWNAKTIKSHGSITSRGKGTVTRTDANGNAYTFKGNKVVGYQYKGGGSSSGAKKGGKGGNPRGH